MPPAALHSVESRCYRLALWLCPPAFRHEHGDEMSRDFDEARDDAATRGRGALWTLRLVMAIDLARTCGVQWLRTGAPVLAIALVAIAIQLTIQLTVWEGLARLARVATIPMPDTQAHADGEVMGVLLLAVASVVVIAMTIALNLWVTRLNRRRRLR